MTFPEALHTVLLGPIELLFDVVFSMSMQVTDSPVLSIVALSLFVNILVLPLYNKADAMQKEEQEISLRLKPRIDRIKKAFSGDERFMMLQTFYRQNHYKPWYVLRGSLSLLLQIPFFMAAYNFLSGLQILQGVSFGPIRDLGKPDGMLQIFGMTVNVLPFLMTGINLISGMIYLRGMPLKSRLQFYGMALVFLVLLYDSPAGLVLYWTLNNLFSLGKNVVNRFRNPGRVLRILCSLAGLVAGVFAVRNPGLLGERRASWTMAAAVVMQLPLALDLVRSWIGKRRGMEETDFVCERSSGAVPKSFSGQNGRCELPFAEEKKEASPEEAKRGMVIFFVGCVLLALLTGVLIPSAVISSSPAEFVEVGHYRSPLHYVWNSFLMGAGTFLIWCPVYFLLAREGTRKKYSLVFAILATVAAVNFMFFGNGYGDMNSLLKYGLDLPVTARQKLVNGIVIVLIAVGILGIWKWKKELVRWLCIVECLAVASMSAVNLVSIGRRLPEIERTAMQAGTEGGQSIIHLDRKGKNVVVLMLDRSIGGLIPFLFQERPELQEQFRGFTLYKNTMSYGASTNTGSPALYGGYDYVPEKIDARTDVLLKDKQNEALKIMPVNFLNAGYEVTVCDPSYANYQWIPDLSIYDDYPEIRRYNTEGSVRGEDEEPRKHFEQVRNRNMFCYSLFRIAPVAMHTELYDLGNYNSSVAEQRMNSASEGTGYDEEFLNAYEVLKALPKITEVRETGQSCFLMMANNTTHNLTLLQEPEYEPRAIVNNTEYDAANPVRYAIDGHELVLGDGNWTQHYQMNMAAYLKVGLWLEELKKQGVYDNTRIVIVADHGWNLGYPGNEETAKAYFSSTAFNPVLMVKDFDSREAFAVSEQFMTNADTPTLAFRELIENPWNPFLDHAVTDADKGKQEQKICMADWHINPADYVFGGSYIVRLNPEAQTVE